MRVVVLRLIIIICKYNTLKYLFGNYFVILVIARLHTDEREHIFTSTGYYILQSHSNTRLSWYSDIWPPYNGYYYSLYRIKMNRICCVPSGIYIRI